MDKENLKYYNKKWHRRYSKFIRAEDPIIAVFILELIVGAPILAVLVLILERFSQYLGQSMVEAVSQTSSVIYALILSVTFVVIPLNGLIIFFLERKGLVDDHAVNYHLYNIVATDDYNEKWDEFKKINRIVSRPSSGIGEEEAAAISDFYDSIDRTRDPDEVERKKKELLPEFIDEIIHQKKKFHTEKLYEIITKSRKTTRDPLPVRVKERFSGKKTGKIVEYLINYRIAFLRLFLSVVAVVYLQLIDVYSTFVVGLLVILVADPKRIIGIINTIRSEVDSIEEQI